jgi:hypothetical protein
MTIRVLMLAVPDEVTAEGEAAELTAQGLGVRPLRVVCQPLSNSGKTIYRVYLPNGQSVVLRTSVGPDTFRFTRLNIDVLRALGLPVQSVLAAGRTASGGSYILLNWVPGRDLVYELAGMSHAQMTRLAEQVVESQRRVGALPPSKGFGWAPIGKNGPLQTWSMSLERPPPRHRSTTVLPWADCGPDSAACAVE